MNILSMGPEHISPVAELERQCFSQPWSETGLAAELDNPNGVFLVAQEQNQVLGYAGMHCAAGECYIANVATLPQARGRGVARALVEALICHARNHACSFITLEVRPSNTHAVALYTRCGFSQVGRASSSGFR